jgi:molybdate transport system substrate-binding protein
MRNASIRSWFAVALLCLPLLGCSRGPASTSPASSLGRSGSVLVLVAASTKDAAQESAAGFSKETGIEVKINADDSSKLATQIVNDAPGDIFLSANEEWAVFVKDKDFAQESVPLLGNGLVIVVPRGNPAQVNKPEDLTGPTVKRIAVAGPTVPAGIYARQALTKLDLWDQLEKAKKVVAGDNVRVALTYVERGEVEAGIVYSTDARVTDQVQAVYTFEPGSHDPIVYPLVLTKAGGKNAAGRKFYDYLQSPRAAAIFKKYGFTRLAGD